MPRVKIDYVVSFSSEDADNPASNLLATEVSKKRWLCKGEPSCSVVLQLARTVKLSSVQIGAHHSALVEVLVGRSETPNDAFKVLIPSCIFLSPSDSRRSEGVERVRSFSSDQLSSETRDQKWDRVRVVCSQPYNKHCKFGLSFIHLFELESAPAPAAAPLAPRFSLPGDPGSSDEEESFKPGQLFAQHSHNSQNSQERASVAATSTEAQIRQATSQVLKKKPESSAKLVKTPINKEKTKPKHNTTAATDNDSNIIKKRNELMYDQDDEQPNAKIDKLMQRHNEQKKNKDDAAKKLDKKHTDKTDFIERPKHNSPSKTDAKEKSKDSSKHNTSVKDDKRGDRTPQSSRKEKENGRGDSRQGKKRSHLNDEESGSKRSRTQESTDKPCLRAGPVSCTPHSLLSGVVAVLSGYVNPRRAAVRDKALALGARVEREWSSECTHLICAFSNTPKLKQVRSSAGGRAAAVATAEWVEACCEARRLLPWQWFATEARYRVDRPDGDGLGDPEEEIRIDSDCDTDDEIERVIKKQKDSQKETSPKPEKRDAKKQESPSPRERNMKKRTSPSPGMQESKKYTSPSSQHQPSPAPQKQSRELAQESVGLVRDERIKGNVTISDSDEDQTDVEEVLDTTVKMELSASLPAFLEGRTFALDASVRAADTVRRYLRAYGGEVLELSQDADSSVDYILCGPAAAAAAVTSAQMLRADWLWRCHAKKRFCSTDSYLLS